MNESDAYLISITTRKIKVEREDCNRKQQFYNLKKKKIKITIKVPVIWIKLTNNHIYLFRIAKIRSPRLNLLVCLKILKKTLIS